MPAPLAKGLRVAGYTFVAFVVGSLVTGGLEGTAFDINLRFGIKTGIPAAIILGAVMGALEARKRGRTTRPTAPDDERTRDE